MSKSKRIGTAAESAVVRYLTDQGLNARRVALAGVLDEGDVHVISRRGRVAVIEVKSGKQSEHPSHEKRRGWWDEAVRESVNVGAAADVPILVMKRRGSGAASVGDWWAVIDYDDLMFLFGGQVGIGGPLVQITVGDLVSALKRAGY